jgi:hypothetical protein
MKVAVLGCGPAGLLAAHACARAGVDFDVISLKRQSPIGGAQFLHVPIPGITGDSGDGRVNFYKHGVKEVYASKVYGDPEAPTSWDSYEEGDHEVWNMQAAYQQLWETYQGNIREAKVDHGFISSNLVWEYDKIFSTIPKTYLCFMNHDFRSQPVWIDMDPAEEIQDSAIIYSGLRSDEWYRASNIFGYSSLEYPDLTVKGEAVRRISKPLSNNCTCWDSTPMLHMFGRYGEWTKAPLIHDAYYGAINALNGAMA